MTRVGKRRLREAIESSGGIISTVAEMFGVTRQTIYNWLEKYPELKDDLDYSRENMIDIAEKNIFNAVVEGDLDQSRFVLTHIGRHRGWSRQMELAGVKGGAPIRIEWVDPFDDDDDIGEGAEDLPDADAE